MPDTLYRRPLPDETIAFSSPSGRVVFAEALAAGGLDGYFPLAEQFHTQSEPSFCGLGSLVVALNALAIDPGRSWKGPWRWFSEELLDCCVSLDEIRRRGLDLDELACLARCNGADVDAHRADTMDDAAWRASLAVAARGAAVAIASYDRSALGQTGDGHFSPIGGYHAQRDLVLVLDVARFKYPPHWISAERMWRAMQVRDTTTARPRGWMLLRPRTLGVALGFSLSCQGEDLQGLGNRLSSAVTELAPTAGVEQLARAIEPLTSHLVVRVPDGPSHQAALDATRVAIRKLAAFPRIRDVVGPEVAEGVTILMLVIADRLAPTRRDELVALIAEAEHDVALATELTNLRAQLAALWIVAGAPRDCGMCSTTEPPA